MNTKTWRVAGIDFSHMHMAELLEMVAKHPFAEIVGICDRSRERMTRTIERLGLSDQQIFTDYASCLEATRPDIIILCSATAEHGDWVERLAPFGAHIIVEKPFAADLSEADRMMSDAQRNEIQLIINWPIRWHASHSSAKRMLEEGAIGKLLEVHHYDGNRGPLLHGSNRKEVEVTEKNKSWFYAKSKGGGSLMDGVTFATWFMNGIEPHEVTTVVDEPPGLDVDEHSVTVVMLGCMVCRIRMPAKSKDLMFLQTLSVASCWTTFRQRLRQRPGRQKSRRLFRRSRSLLFSIGWVDRIRTSSSERRIARIGKR